MLKLLRLTVNHPCTRFSPKQIPQTPETLWNYIIWIHKLHSTIFCTLHLTLEVTLLLSSGRMPTCFLRKYIVNDCMVAYCLFKMNMLKFFWCSNIMPNNNNNNGTATTQTQREPLHYCTVPYNANILQTNVERKMHKQHKHIFSQKSHHLHHRQRKIHKTIFHAFINAAKWSLLFTLFPYYLFVVATTAMHVCQKFKKLLFVQLKIV